MFAGLLHHELRVLLDPAAGTLQASDEVDLPAGVEARFLLHAGLHPHSTTPGVTFTRDGRVEGVVPLDVYRVSLAQGSRRFGLTYGGRIVHDFTTLKESPGRSRRQLAGTISPQGVFLDGATGWYPVFADTPQSFSLEVTLPDGWLAVSQGAGPKIERAGNDHVISWREDHPQDEIYLVAEPFQVYRQPGNNVESQVFLRQPDDALAQRYLDATTDYLQLFTHLIGPYPYAKFATVENFWETGYGMPSFTLLGSQVIRLPFILHSSFPHEILHNWWGNSVYVDYASGNWSEGLTSYLADHLLAEQQGKGVEYRRSALQRYADFVRAENDFPLDQFRGRHSTASQAVGYDKSLMLFHMLRRELGDSLFIAGLRRFYRDNRFKTAGFAQLQAAFEAVSQRPLGAFFKQWTSRTGAPDLAVEAVSVRRDNNAYRLSGRLVQRQQAPAFRLRVPLVIQLRDGTTLRKTLEMGKRQAEFAYDLPAEPLRLQVDPWFDVFRRLDPAETPPTLGRFFGADRVTLVLPAAAAPELLAGYRALAQQWAAGYDDAEIRLDSDLPALPRERPVLLLGWENRFLDHFLDGLKDYPFAKSNDSLTLDGKRFPQRDHAFALAEREGGGGETRLWVGTRNPASLPGLARKLPHYGKYSLLAFAGDTPDNRLKGQWPVLHSPLRIVLSASPAPQLPEPPPLIASARAQSD
ncbi:MAG: M1 family aminopeptidase [Candidatus Thiodiazotropha sp.]